MTKTVHFITARAGRGYSIAAEVDGKPCRLLRDDITSAADAKRLGGAYLAGALIAGARVSSTEPPEVRKQA